MEPNTPDLPDAESTFEETLEQLRQAMNSKPRESQPSKAKPVEPPSDMPTDLAIWEDAIADIEKFLESKNLNPPDED
ncbi:hypothetical protein NEA10_08050 [Phormidium yuhuli AB48]|uniref:Uncharacterized protein n=1 Tax=Phormidium yuhuli AB48 TaxID=2940671 RepID=A0ABY5ATV9_9CYAN|nr:hypothetical protein [Phormidium yuhuli]USR92657.1 hypothetical protein NEA10_08050 [Phormidium yuhuli AB48]